MGKKASGSALQRRSDSQLPCLWEVAFFGQEKLGMSGKGFHINHLSANRRDQKDANYDIQAEQT